MALHVPLPGSTYADLKKVLANRSVEKHTLYVMDANGNRFWISEVNLHGEHIALRIEPVIEEF